MQYFHENDFIVGRIRAKKSGMSHWIGYLLNTRGQRFAVDAHEAVRDELVDGGESHSSDRSRGLLRLDDLQERRQERARIDFAQIFVNQQLWLGPLYQVVSKLGR